MAINVYIQEDKDSDLIESNVEIEKLNKEIIKLSKTTKEIQEAINNLTQQIIKMEKTPKIIQKIKTPTNIKLTTHSDKKDNNEFSPGKFSWVLWENLSLNGDEICYLNKRNAKSTLPLTIYELEIIREANEKIIQKKDFNELCDLLPVSPNTVSKAIFNIRNNSELQELLDELHEKIINCRFQITTKGFIKIGETVTPIKQEQLEDWIFQCQNSNHLHKLIYNIQHQHPLIEDMQINIICENYNNDNLIKLLDQKKDKFVENNPSKRRNLLQNR